MSCIQISDPWFRMPERAMNKQQRVKNIFILVARLELINSSTKKKISCMKEYLNVEDKN